VWLRGSKQRSLNVDEEIAFENEFPLLVFLGSFICPIIFPSEDGSAFDAVNIPDGVVACRHLAVIGFAFDDVDDPVEEIGAPMLAIECSRYHRVDTGEVGFAL